VGFDAEVCKVFVSERVDATALAVALSVIVDRFGKCKRVIDLVLDVACLKKHLATVGGLPWSG
jgi:hypothetical protein